MESAPESSIKRTLTRLASSVSSRLQLDRLQSTISSVGEESRFSVSKRRTVSKRYSGTEIGGMDQERGSNPQATTNEAKLGPPEVGDGQASGQLTHFFLCLDSDVFVGQEGDQLAAEVRAARATGVQIVMAHVINEEEGGCPFSRCLLEPTWGFFWGRGASMHSMCRHAFASRALRVRLTSQCALHTRRKVLRNHTARPDSRWALQGCRDHAHRRCPPGRQHCPVGEEAWRKGQVCVQRRKSQLTIVYHAQASRATGA
jgi:hypothetical protein